MYRGSSFKTKFETCSNNQLTIIPTVFGPVSLNVTPTSDCSNFNLWTYWAYESLVNVSRVNMTGYDSYVYVMPYEAMCIWSGLAMTCYGGCAKKTNSPLIWLRYNSGNDPEALSHEVQ